METNGVSVEVIRTVDHDIATGVWPDMTEDGWDRDEWPAIFEKVIAADDAGQYAYYGRVGGCLITGNEDGIKHCAMEILYSLGHLGFTIPPQADAGWIGEAGPGPSYLDPGLGRAGERLHQPQHHVHDVELPHLARMLKDAGGIPAHGNQRTEWDAGCRFDYENPEHR